jgi:hypothetical protein
MGGIRKGPDDNRDRATRKARRREDRTSGRNFPARHDSRRASRPAFYLAVARLGQYDQAFNGFSTAFVYQETRKPGRRAGNERKSELKLICHRRELNPAVINVHFSSLPSSSLCPSAFLVSS